MSRQSVALIDTTGPQQTPLADIPQDVKDFVEEVYARQRKTPGRERVTYSTDRERDEEYKLITDYVAQRPAKLGGVLRVRRSPSKDLPPHTMDIRFTADLEANGNANANRPSGDVGR